MLKLRKDAHNRDINIVVKDSSGRFTQHLKVAFLIALGIHLFLLFGFQITKLKFNYLNSPSLPTTVIAESPTLQTAAFAATDSTTNLDKRIPIRPDLYPLLGSIHDVVITEHKMSDREVIASNNPFDPLENELFVPKLLSRKRNPQKPIQLVIAGDIHNMLLIDGLADTKLPKLPKKVSDLGAARVIFAVAIDTKDGTICWHETLEKSSIASLDTLAENILSAMKFIPSSDNIIAKGTVEVHYHIAPDSEL